MPLCCGHRRRMCWKLSGWRSGVEWKNARMSSRCRRYSLQREKIRGKEHKKHKRHKRLCASCVTDLYFLVFLTRFFGRAYSPPREEGRTRHKVNVAKPPLMERTGMSHTAN